MGKNSADSETVYTNKTPKHLLEIGISSKEYFDLKVYIKSMIALPGFPGFGGHRFNRKENQKAYRQWLHSVLLQLGPKYFPEGQKELVWPDNYDRIYKAVNQVVRTLSYKIRKEHERKVEGVRAVERETRNDKMEMEMAGDGERYGGGPAGITDDGDVVVAAEEVLWRQEQEKEIMVVEEHDEEKEVTDEEMRAAAIELEDLLDLMEPEAPSSLPGLTDEDFDWDRVAGFCLF